MSAPKHGTASTYKNHGCRCPACRAAAVAYQRAYLSAAPAQRGRRRAPAEEAREHLRLPRRVGRLDGQVARLSGVSRRTPCAQSSKGAGARAARSTDEAIAAVPLGTTQEALRCPPRRPAA